MQEENVPIYTLLKTLENQRFSGVFRGYEIGTLGRNELKWAVKVHKNEMPVYASDLLHCTSTSIVSSN